MKKIILFLVILATSKLAYSQLIFPSLDSFFNYTKQHSVALKTNDFKLSYAKKARLLARTNIIVPTANASFNYTNNTQLPVNVFPAEAFGGSPGTFRQVTTGIQYNSNFNANAELNVLNLQTWKNAQLAKLNLENTEIDNKISEKKLYENIAATYYNVIQLQAQQKTAFENKIAADSLYQITINKYQNGNLRIQDVNDAKVSFWESIENCNQLQYLLQQQYQSLKILCDFKAQDSLFIAELNDNYILRNTIVFKNELNVNNSIKLQKYAKANYQNSKYAYMPHVSLFASNSFQQFNTKSTLFDKNIDWIQSNYIGFKLNVPILPSSNTMVQTAKAKYDYQVAQKNAEHAKIESEINYQLLKTELDKTISQALTNKSIWLARKDSYQKNLELYKSGIIGLDQTLKSFNAMVSSEYNYIASNISIMHIDSKIEINNRIK